MVQFLPLDVTDEESIGVVLSHIDNAIQYGEHEEPKGERKCSRSHIDLRGEGKLTLNSAGMPLLAFGFCRTSRCRSPVILECYRD